MKMIDLETKVRMKMTVTNQEQMIGPKMKVMAVIVQGMKAKTMTIVIAHETKAKTMTIVIAHETKAKTMTEVIVQETKAKTMTTVIVQEMKVRRMKILTMTGTQKTMTKTMMMKKKMTLKQMKEEMRSDSDCLECNRGKATVISTIINMVC